MPMLSVASFNLAKDAYDWPRRARLVVEGLAALNVDVIGFQEVATNIDQGNWICSWLNALRSAAGKPTFEIHHMANPRGNVATEALALMSTLPILRHEGYDYLFRNRVAHRVSVRVDGVDCDIWNTHLHHERGPEHDAVRTSQAERLLGWVNERSGSAPTVVVGDLNSFPDSAALGVLRARFRSGYEVAHGREAETTASPMAKFASPELRDRDCAFDYVLVDAAFQVVTCNLILNQPATADAGPYPSDHVGVFAELKVRA